MGRAGAGRRLDERELRRVVRAAAESVYGVVAVVGPRMLDRLGARLNFGESGITVATSPNLAVTVDLQVAATVPQAQVASNVADAVRYYVERDMGRHVTNLTVRVDGRPVATDQPSANSSGADSNIPPAPGA
jgi:uncharacterized alkaline shock family protein YloU